MDTAKLIMDFGIDTTKCILLSNDTVQCFEVLNKFSQIDSVNENLFSSYSSDDSCIFSIEDNDNISGLFVNGKMQEMEYIASANLFKFTKTKVNKFEQDIIYLILHQTLIRVYQYVGQEDIEFIFVVNKDEIESCRTNTQRILDNIKTVNSIYPSYNITVSVKDIKTLPKGYCAYASYIFDLDLGYIEENKHLLSEDVLVIDIDFFETNCTIISNNSATDFNMKYPYGYERLISNISTNLILTGNTLYSKDIENYLETGQSENEQIIVENINTELENFSRDFAKGLSNVLTECNFTNILVCGKGVSFNTLSNMIITKLSSAFNKTLVLVNQPKLLPYNLKQEDMNLLGASILGKIL